MPITARARISSRRTTATVSQEELFPLLVRFDEDWVTMVERVKELRELEDVLGKIGGLRGRDALIDHGGCFR